MLKPVSQFLSYLSENNIKAVEFGKQTVRMVTHLDFDDGMLEKVVTALKKYGG